MKTEIRARKPDWDHGFELLILQIDEIKDKCFVGELTFKEVPDGAFLKATLFIGQRQLKVDNPQIMQVLMDDLWNCGIRPSEGAGSAGSLKATQYHLEDMRKLIFEEAK